jgi:hypothetical protein
MIGVGLFIVYQINLKSDKKKLDDMRIMLCEPHRPTHILSTWSTVRNPNFAIFEYLETAFKLQITSTDIVASPSHSIFIILILVVY